MHENPDDHPQQPPFPQGHVPPQGYVPQQPQGYPPQYQGYPQQSTGVTPPPQRPRRRSRLLTIGGIIGGLVLVCCIAGIVFLAASGKGATTTSGSNSGGSSGTSGSSAPSSNGPAKVGDTITANDVSVTAVSVKPLQGDEFNQPKAGNEFIVVHVKITNKSGSEISYNPLDFHVKTGTGNITDEDFASPSSYTANNMLNSGSLASGGSVQGDIIFQVPVGDHKAELTWQSSFFSDKADKAWSLGL